MSYNYEYIYSEMGWRIREMENTEGMSMNDIIESSRESTVSLEMVLIPLYTNNEDPGLFKNKNTKIKYPKKWKVFQDN